MFFWKSLAFSTIQWMLVIVLYFSPVAYWTPSNLRGSFSIIILSFHTVYGVLQARTLESVAISSSSGLHFVRILNYDLSILDSPAQHGSQIHGIMQVSLLGQGCDPCRDLSLSFILNRYSRDFSSGSAVKNLPSNTGGVGSIPGWGMKIPHSRRQLQGNVLQVLRPTCLKQRSPQVTTKSLYASMKTQNSENT